VLTHAAGVPQAPAGVTLADLADWDLMCARIADLEPLWEPGAETGYHALTYGYILGEVVRRVTGHPIARVLREEVTGPLGVADDLFFGVRTASCPGSHGWRTAAGRPPWRRGPPTRCSSAPHRPPSRPAPSWATGRTT
jgi:CubicO group peptidase (beta-lactamase class C family)